MSSPPILNCDELLNPIPGDQPQGNPLPFTARKQLDDFRKEINPAAFAPDDPLRPEQPKYADWTGIIRLGQETLATASKDLLVAARMTEALVKEHGFAGLRDGLKLMRRLVAECWDRVYPSIEDGDLEVRATPFNWLDDADRGARFPGSVRAVPLIFADGQRFGWQQWREVQDAKPAATPEDDEGARPKVTRETFDKVIAAMSRAECETLVDDLTASLEELRGLTEVLSTRLGELAPGMVEVRKAVFDCHTLAKQILTRKPAAIAAPAEEAPAEEASANNGAPAAEARPAARQRATTR